MKAKVIIPIACVVVCIAGYFGWKTETFQKNAFPKKYWAKQVDTLKFGIATSNYLIRDLELELQKKHMTFGLELAQASNTAQQFGLDVNEARQDSMKEVQEEINALNKAIETLQESIEKTENLLRQARLEYSK